MIAGAAVFFIILIVKIVVGLINTKDSGNAIKCIDSILNFKSYDDQRDEAIENTASSCIELYKMEKIIIIVYVDLQLQSITLKVEKFQTVLKNMMN